MIKIFLIIISIKKFKTLLDKYINITLVEAKGRMSQGM